MSVRQAARPTVKDVAVLASVSPKTVSNVLNGAVFVRPDTRDRVQAAIEQLGYVPNLSARGLRNGRSGVIAVALPDLSTPYSAEIVQTFVRLAHRRGLVVLVEETAAEPQREVDLISQARAHLIDGLILNPVTLEDSAIAHTGALPPVVLIGEVRQSKTDHVEVDSVAAARDMTAHLLAQGARRIALLGAPGDGFDSATSRLRLEGYRTALREAGIPEDNRLLIPCAAWTTPDGDAAMSAALEHGERGFDAVFALTDTLALGALGALWRHGVRVPDDVLVGGFDDIAQSAHVIPPLTTVGFDRAEFVGAALDLLVRRFDDRETPPHGVTVGHRIVARASTAR